MYKLASAKYRLRVVRWAAPVLTVSALACAILVMSVLSASEPVAAPGDSAAGNAPAEPAPLARVAGLPKDVGLKAEAGSGEAGGPLPGKVARPTAEASEPAAVSAPRELAQVSREQARLSDVVPMSAVSRVNLRVWGLSEFNGEYAVDAGTMSLPGLGRFDVSDKSILDLETYLSTRMSQAYRRDVTVSAAVARYNPYYVAGHVAQPGQIEWRPGLTVIQAVTLAGGEMRTGTAASAGGSPESLLTVRQARGQLRLSLAQLERLKAEKDNLDRFTPSRRLSSMDSGDAEEIDTLARRQNKLLEERRGIMHAQLEGLRNEHESAGRVLRSAEAQAEAVERQLELARKVLDGTRTLREMKLVSNSRYLEQQSAVATAEVQLAEVQALLETQRARVSSIERQMGAVRHARIAEINDRVETLEREIAQHELTIATIGPGNVASAPAQVAFDYNIARNDKSGIATIPATIFTSVLPGDVVIVSPRPVEPVATASVGVERQQAELDPMRETISRTERLIAASSAARSAATGTGTGGGSRVRGP